jgi:hypothetical protein
MVYIEIYILILNINQSNDIPIPDLTISVINYKPLVVVSIIGKRQRWCFLYPIYLMEN